MDIQTLTTFFMWCSIINGGILILWLLIYVFAPDCIYRIQTKWFPVPRETFNVAMYTFYGLFKVFFIFLNIVPYIALRIIG